MVVEGEKCVDAWRRVWPERLVTTWPGGCDQWHLADWTVLAARGVAVLADANKGGRDAAQGIAHKLHSLGCTVQVALPDGDTGEDVADWIAADGPEATAARIAALLQPYEPPPEPEETAGAPAVEIGDAGRGWADSNQFFRVLGVGEHGDPAVRLAGGAVLRLHRPSLTSRGQLVALAPRLDWWATITGQAKLTGQLALRLGADILAAADARGVYELDADPGIAALADGRILDLADGSTREPDGDADRYVTKRLGFDAVDQDGPVEWLKALGRLFDDDEIAWLQAWFGYSLTGHARVKRFVFLSGPRDGGKSTIVDTLARLAGSYHVSVPDDAFTSTNERHREYLARLEGARAVTATELAEGTWRSGVLKTLSGGGSDTVTANRMRENSRDFRPVCKLTFCGNVRPRIPGGADSGLAGRLVNVAIPRIPDSQLDEQLGRKLAAELPRIAAWALQGTHDYLVSRTLPSIPRRWAAATREYLSTEDTIGAWFDARCKLDPEAFTLSSEIVASYKEHSGGKLTRATPIYSWLDEHHAGATSSGQKAIGRGRHGIKLVGQ